VSKTFNILWRRSSGSGAIKILNVLLTVAVI
jgi:hypothetical protein